MKVPVQCHATYTYTGHNGMVCCPTFAVPSLHHLPFAIGENMLLEDKADGPARFAEAVPKQDREFARLAEAALDGAGLPVRRTHLLHVKMQLTTSMLHAAMNHVKNRVPGSRVSAVSALFGCSY